MDGRVAELAGVSLARRCRIPRRCVRDQSGSSRVESGQRRVDRNLHRAPICARVGHARCGGSRHDDSGGHRRMDRLRRGRDRSGHRSRCGSPSDSSRLLTLTIAGVSHSSPRQ